MFTTNTYFNLQKGVITKVSDGDTLTFVPDKKKGLKIEWKIRLAEIDCPESDQPGGKEATDYLKVFSERFYSRCVY